MNTYDCYSYVMKVSHSSMVLHFSNDTFSDILLVS